MTYILKLKGNVEKELEQIPRIYQERIYKAIFSIKNNPFIGKKLHGNMANQRSIRVWPYRIIYEINKSEITVTVICIRHRKDVYK